MADYKVTDTQLTSIANAIRAKTGKEAQIEFPAEFVSEIGSISGGVGGSGSNYYENSDGTLGVLIEQKDGYLYSTWYFNGFTKSESNVSIPSGLEYLLFNSSTIGTYAYSAADSQEGNGIIGFYNRAIRSWNRDVSKAIAGTFYGTLYLRNNVYDPDKSTAAIGGVVWESVAYSAPPSA